MADELIARSWNTSRVMAAEQPRSVALNLKGAIDVNRRLWQPAPAPAVTPPAPPAPTPAPPVAPAPVVTLPPAPATNAFEHLPFPSSGERIKAEDFRALSQALRIIYEHSVLAGTLFGRTFAEAKLLLAQQQYVIGGVTSVLGATLADAGDATLDGRTVVGVVPAPLGERRILIVLSEAVDQRRYMPDLTAAPTLRDAQQVLIQRVGLDRTATPPAAPNYVGLSLADLQRTLRP
jgi:hypothetical protein